MVTLAATNTQYKSWIASEDDTIILLEKAQSGRTTLDDIADALDEYKRLFIAGLASPGETFTLSRAYPDNEEYAEACLAINDDEDEEKVMIVGGPASVEAVDREGHLITSDALKKAFKKYMDNFRGRNVMVMHSDVQVGHALPAYISKAGNVFKSGVDDKGLFFISELRDDTKIANRVRDQIKKGGMSSYSIAGSATQSKEINKSDGSHVLQVDDMELAEVTICEKGVNQNAHFELLKGDKAEGSCADGSCLTKSHDSTPEPEIIAISKSEIPSFKNMFMNWVSKESKGIPQEMVDEHLAEVSGQSPEQYRTAKRLARERPKTIRDIQSQVSSARGGYRGDSRRTLRDIFASPTFEILTDKYDQAMLDPTTSDETKQKLHEEILSAKNPQSIYYNPLLAKSIVKESKDEDTSRAVAIATAQAKKEGYKKFTDGSPGDNRRDKIAEEIKESLKKAFLRKQDSPKFGWVEDYTYYPESQEVEEGQPVIHSEYDKDTGIVTTRENILDDEGNIRGVSGRTGFEEGKWFKNPAYPEGGRILTMPRNAFGGGPIDEVWLPRDSRSAGAKQKRIIPEGTESLFLGTEKSITKELFLDKLKELV